MLFSRNFAAKTLLILAAIALLSLSASAATLTITADGATATAANFWYAGGTPPEAQAFTVNNASGPVTITKAVFQPNATGYLGQGIFQASTSGSTLHIGIPNTGALTGLLAGTYTGTLHIEAGSDSADFTVNLNMGSSGTVVASSTSVRFASVIGGGQQQQTITLTGPAAGVNYTTSVTDGANWISVSPASGTTIANPNVTITVIPQQLGSVAAAYTGNVRISPSGVNPIDIKVTLNLGTTGSLIVSPLPLQTFAYTTGGLLPAAQTVYVSSGSANYYIASVSPGAAWLYVNGASQMASWAPLSTPLTISVVPTGLGTGTYTGTITVTGNDGTTAAPISVTLAVNSTTSTVTVNPLSLTFQSQLGATPQGQTVSMTTGAVGVTYSATVFPSGSWLTLSSATGSVPGSLGVYVNPANLSGSTYTGQVTLSFYKDGALIDTKQVAVIFTVGSGGTATGATVAPTQLSFAMPEGSTITLPGQELAVSGSAGALYTVSTGTTDGKGWLSVGTTSGSIPGKVVVGINSAVATTLAAGTYTGTVTVQSSYFSSVVTVSLKVVAATSPILQPSLAAITVFYDPSAPYNPPYYVNLSSSTGALNFAATSANPAWITITNPTGTTPSSFVASLAVGTLPAGVNSGSIQLIATDASGNAAANSPITIPVTVVVAGAQGPVTVTPATLSFSTAVGASPASQNLSVGTSAASAAFTASASSTGGWLSVSPTSGTATSSAPVTLTVSANATGLAANTYTGTITITSGGSVQTANVTLTVGGGVSATLSVGSQNLTFDYQQGASAPASQSISLSSSPASISFTTSASTTWLSVTPASGTTPATATVSINPQGLAAGTYSGTVTITAPGASNSPQTRTVTLTVREAANLSASPVSLNFLYRTDGGVPAPQTITVTSSGSALSYSATSNATWLSVSPATGTTTGQIGVSANPAGLNPGNYTGQITISTSGAAIASSAKVDVALTVSAPLPTVTQILNAASYQKAPVAPGEIVSLFGDYMGPNDLVTLKLEGSALARKLSEVRVLFSGIEAPLVYVSARQISAIVPYALAGKTTTAAQVEYRGVRSNSVTLDVVSSAPGVFTANASGTGPGAILNQDYSVNSASNPAARGSVVMLYVTGEGQTIPLGVDGKVHTDANNLPKPVLPVSVTIGGQDAKVLYYGAAPGMVSGLMQINVEVPLASATGNDVPVTFTVGNQTTSQPGVTLAVK